MHRGVLLSHFPLASLLNPDPTAAMAAVLLLLLLLTASTTLADLGMQTVNMSK
jgi:hypothetical protein